MEPLERARLCVAIQNRFREAMLAAILPYTQDPAEQTEIAGGVLALMLKKMYEQQGHAWLELVLQQVLQPSPSGPPLSSSLET